MLISSIMTSLWLHVAFTDLLKSSKQDVFHLVQKHLISKMFPPAQTLQTTLTSLFSLEFTDFFWLEINS